TLDGIAALFLAFLLRTAEDAVNQTFPGGKLRIAVNMGAPFARVGNSTVPDVFERVFYTAWRLRHDARQNWPQKEALSALAKAWGGAKTLPEPAERPTCVIPEAHAAVAGMLLNENVDSGYYAVVDIG